MTLSPVPFPASTRAAAMTLVTIVLASWSAGEALAGERAAIGAAPARAAHVLRTRELRTLAGGTLKLGDARGQVVVVNFWASWCAPCRRELPQLAVLDSEIRSREGRVVAVSIDADRRNVERFLRANGLDLTVVLDGPNGIARELDLRNVPCTVVLGRDGEVAYFTSRSDQKGLDDLVAATREALAARPVAAVSSAEVAR